MRRPRVVTAVSWVTAITIAATMLFGIHTFVRAATPPTATELTNYLVNNELFVGIANVDGYDQIYYFYNNERFFITTDAYNHSSPKANKQYITWQGELNGGGQIFLYNVLTGVRTQLTATGVNEGPSLYLNRVVWRRWMGSYYNIFYYNGTTIANITNNTNSSISPTITNNQIAYVTRVSATRWSVFGYNTSTLNTTTLLSNTTYLNSFPRYINGILRTQL